MKVIRLKGLIISYDVVTDIKSIKMCETPQTGKYYIIITGPNFIDGFVDTESLYTEKEAISEIDFLARVMAGEYDSSKSDIIRNPINWPYRQYDFLYQYSDILEGKFLDI